MPRGDKTGPNGAGPKTGRGGGFCTGNDTAGYENNNLPRRGGGGMGSGLQNGSGAGRNGGFGNGRRNRSVPNTEENTK